MGFRRQLVRVPRCFRQQTRYAASRLGAQHLQLSQKVYHCDPTTTIEAASLRMTSENIGCLMVTENGKVVGLITERDVIRVVGKEGGFEPSLTVGSFMTPAEKLFTLGPEDNLV